MLSPVLYTIYTNDYRSHHESTKIIKFADDSSIIGLLQDNEIHYQNEVQGFVGWCQENFLTVNVAKTKELIVDFRIHKDPLDPITINDQKVEIITSYKYLGMYIDNDLKWSVHANNLLKSCNQRLYFLRKLNLFNVNKAIMKIFYSSTIESLITFGIVCYGCNLNKNQKQGINRVIKKA